MSPAEISVALRALRYRTVLTFSLELLSRPSAVELEVVIPASRKDWPVLPFAMRSARRFLKHPVRAVYVVGPEKPADWDNFAQPSDVFLEEKDVAPVRKQDIDLRPGGIDRSGWMLQQLIKLSAECFCKGEHILVLDADTVFLRPQRLIRDGKLVLNVSDEHYDPYYAQIGRMLPTLPISPFSFISHHMIMQASILKELKKEVERDGKKWDMRILASVDPSEQSGFSEYELYGNFMLARHKEQVDIEHSLNIGMAPSRIDRLTYIKLRHPFSKTASFHAR